MKAYRQEVSAAVIITVEDGTSEAFIKTINSLLCQKGYNAQIFVIDTTAQIKELFKSYKSKNPAFEDYIQTQPGKISAAIELALSHTKAQYTAFFNSGDTVSSEFFSTLLNAAESNKGINLFAAKEYTSCAERKNEAFINLLSAQRGKSTRIIDVKKEPQCIKYSLNGALLRTSALKNLCPFKELKNDLGAEITARMLLENSRYYYSTECRYIYSTAQEDDFLYNPHTRQRDWYTVSLEKFLLPLLQNAKSSHGTLPEFLQFFALYHIQPRFLANFNNANKRAIDSETEGFLASVKNVLTLVDNSIIVNEGGFLAYKLSAEDALMLLRLKYGTKAVTPTMQGEAVTFGGARITALKNQKVGIEVLNFKDGVLYLDASLSPVIQSTGASFFASFGGKEYVLNDNGRYSVTKYFGLPAYKRFTFNCKFSLPSPTEETQLSFFAELGGKKYPLLISFTHHWSKLCDTPKSSYWRFDEYIATHDGKSIKFSKAKKAMIFLREIKFLTETLKESRMMFILRLLYRFTRPYFAGKKIWFMYDKLYKGGDSSEYLYRFCKNKNDGITKYYVADKNTSDYQKLKKDGLKPVATRSLLHRMAFLNASLVFSTNSTVFSFNGYGVDRSRFIRSLCGFFTVCMQHGLTVQKCAMAQQRIIDNTGLYFIASQHEKQNLLHHAYGYDGFDALRLTGIARYDGLKNDDRRQILISPTWRMYNAMPVTHSEGVERDYNSAFKETAYFKVYNSLINNKKLIGCAKEYGYKIKYLLHPIVSSQAKDYTKNDWVEIVPSVGNLSYEKILTQSSLMVTDFSGVQFDFAYMKKPIVYFHPTELPAHYDDGCFDYKTMGFGEICDSAEELVDTLCNYMKNECRIKDEYKKRVGAFFEYGDHENCKRIYEECLRF